MFPEMVGNDVLSAEIYYLLAPREVIKVNMPPAFNQFYSSCVCIIDCSEIFIENPANFMARNATYSNYKKHNTVKILIGITPYGSISFLSKCWDGHASDKVITKESNFLYFIELGHVVLINFFCVCVISYQIIDLSNATALSLKLFD